MGVPYVQFTYNSLNAGTVNTDVMKQVAKLVKEGYVVEITLHTPVTHVYRDGSTEVEHISTVRGVLSEYQNLIKLGKS